MFINLADRTKESIGGFSVSTVLLALDIADRWGKYFNQEIEEPCSLICEIVFRYNFDSVNLSPLLDKLKNRGIYDDETAINYLSNLSNIIGWWEIELNNFRQQKEEELLDLKKDFLQKKLNHEN